MDMDKQEQNSQTLNQPKEAQSSEKKINVDEYDGSETAYETYKGTIEPWTGQPINFDTYD